MFVIIVDYGSGNIKSVYNSVKRTMQNFNKFSEVKVSKNLSEIEKADKIILPGVGSFDQCMNRIRKIEDLLESGVHFGHNVRRWNPKMKEYIYGVRNNIHIFDLRITLELLNIALTKIHETVSKSAKDKIEKAGGTAIEL